MKTIDLEAKMRELEYFHAIKILPQTWTIIRVDGRSFSRFTLDRFKKPFDEKFRDMMIVTASKLVKELGGIYAFTESDEISILFAPEWNLFDRKLEKVVSISSSIASASFSMAANEYACFDSRVWLGPNEQAVIDYFRWRQADASRCAINGWCYWTLRENNFTVGKATSILKGMKTSDKNELLFSNGINFNDVAMWQKRGIGIYWEEYRKDAINPLNGATVEAQRRRLKCDLELPMGNEYEIFLQRIMNDNFSKP